MKQVCVALADGFEEVEALTVVDLLRREAIPVVTASISGNLEVTGSHHICVMADTLFEKIDFEEVDMLVLPGGKVGTDNLMESQDVADALEILWKNGKQLAAICAAPSVLGMRGYLKDQKACCYPGFEDKLLDAEIVYDQVAVNPNVITSRGMGTAIPFGLALIERLKDEDAAKQTARSIIYG